jgi:integrase
MTSVADSLAIRPPGGARTWTVIDADYRTVGPVEEWLEAHRPLWSPNTVRGYSTSLAQWWTFLEQRAGGGVLRNTNFRSRVFDRAKKELGLPGLRVHDLRHTAASLAIASGANVKAVQSMLGHASAAMTLDVYAEDVPSSVELQ